MDFSNRVGFIIGQAYRVLELKREHYPFGLYDKAKTNPAQWLAHEKFWIDYYGLDYELIAADVQKAQEILSSHDSRAIKEYQEALLFGEMLPQTTFKV